MRVSRKEKTMKTEDIKTIRIIIDEAHKRMIQEAIDEAEGQSRTRTIGAGTVIEDTATIAKYFGVSRRAMDGLVVDVDPYCQYFPNAYKDKGSPKSTHFKVQFMKRKAYLTAVYRDYVRTPGSYYIAEVMPDKLKEALIARFERGNEKALYPPPEED